MARGGHDFKAVGLGVLEASLVLTAVVSVLTAFNEWHHYLELFAHFRLQYLVVAVILTAAFLWLRWAGYAVLGVACIALNAWFVVPWYLPVERGEPAAPELTLLNANVQLSNVDHDAFHRLVEATAPDIIALEEVTPAWAASLDGLNERYPHRVVEARDDAFGIALFSRLPIGSAAVRSAEPNAYPEILATVEAGSWQLQIIVAHPAPPIPGPGSGARNLQLAGIAALAQRTPTPLVVAGDLNITMWAQPYERLLADAGLRNAREGFGVAPTWPTFMLPAMIPIDHILVSDDIEVSGFRTGAAIGSDHLPIIATIRPRSGAQTHAP